MCKWTSKHNFWWNTADCIVETDDHLVTKAPSFDINSESQPILKWHIFWGMSSWWLNVLWFLEGQFQQWCQWWSRHVYCVICILENDQTSVQWRHASRLLHQDMARIVWRSLDANWLNTMWCLIWPSFWLSGQRCDICFSFSIYAQWNNQSGSFVLMPQMF